MSSRKTKTVTLEFPVINNDRDLDPRAPGAETQVFRVTRITDSTDYMPGQQLLKKQVQELCAAPDWKVTIVPVG